MKTAVPAVAAVLIGAIVALSPVGAIRAGPAVSLTVAIAPNTLACGGGASFVVVRAHDAGGNVVSAGTVYVTTSLGSISQSPVVDDGTGVVVILMAPEYTGGVAVVTAVNDSSPPLTATATATVTCKPSCKDGGWMTAKRADGSSFKSQGDCIQYANGKK